MGALIDFTAKRNAKLTQVAPVVVATPVAVEDPAPVAPALNPGWRSGIETIYVDTADTAKLVRAELKQVFPAFKFKVRISRYSMGSSIYISWTDGPTEKQVKAALDKYDGSYFDAMTDYHGSTIRKGEDGKHYNYEGSISCSRHLSEAVILYAAKQLLAERGIDFTPTLDRDGCVRWGEHYELQTGFWVRVNTIGVDEKGTILGVVNVENTDAGNVVRYS